MDTADQGAHSLCAAWDENAEDWVRWARSPECDHAFWHLNLPALLALLPPPGELTLDVGCGEGPHHPLGSYFGALQDAGFLVERVVEPVPEDAYVAAFPEAGQWLERPGFLHVRALLGR